MKRYVRIASISNIAFVLFDLNAFKCDIIAYLYVSNIIIRLYARYAIIREICASFNECPHMTLNPCHIITRHPTRKPLLNLLRFGPIH